MSKEPELKARDKVVLRMKREGAVEENLTAITVPVCEETPCCSKAGGLNGVSEGSGSGTFWGGFSVLFSSVTDVSEGG